MTVVATRIPLGQRFDLGIIPCTSGKWSHGTTAKALYKGSIFTLMMRHAQQRCERILILSAKYGLLDLDDPAGWYNVYLGDLPDKEKMALGERVEIQIRSKKLEWAPTRAIGPPTVLSYLSNGYHEFLMRGDFVNSNHTRTWLYQRPYAKLGMLKMSAALSMEIRAHATHLAGR